MSDAERREEVVLLACNIDDMTGEELGYALELMLRQGALDAWHTPIVMKKSRPAVVFSVLARPGDAAHLREALLVHTSTLGVRWETLQRAACERRTLTVETPWGAVRCKLKLLAGRALAVKAEYEDCARAAEAHGVPLRQVAREAERLALAE
ncbi:MAG: nickel insertion protein [Anaerolineae bacterium]|jgi:uncharacterized protein (DUF111 family)